MPSRATVPEAEIRAELCTVLAYSEETGELRPLEHLLKRARDSRDTPASLRLLIECDLEALRSRHREVAESVRVWETLERRAAVQLSQTDAALMSIRSLHAQYVRRRAAPGDGALSVRMCAAELRRRQTHLGADHPRTALARTNYAVALRESGEGRAVATALRLLEDEAMARLTRYGPEHPFTWVAQVVLAQTQVRTAEGCTDEAERRRYAQQAAENARVVLESRSRRYGGSDRSTLRAHLVYAEALLMLGRDEEAEPEIRGVLAASLRRGTALDPGWAELLLARSLARRSPAEALRHAKEALRGYRAYHGPTSRRAEEAAHLVRTLPSLG